MNSKISPFRCPVCKKTVNKKAENFPFCSARCRTIDLGRWASGEHCIAGEPAHIPNDPDSEF